MATITRFKGRERRGGGVPAMPSLKTPSASVSNLDMIGKAVSQAGKLIGQVHEDNERSLFDLNYATMKNTIGEKQVAYRKAMETANISEQETLTENYKLELDDLRGQVIGDPNGGGLYKKLIGTKSELLVGSRKNEADLDSFQYKRKNTIVNKQAGQQQRKLTNQGYDYELNRSETLGAMSNTDNLNIMGEKEKFNMNRAESNNYIESIGSGAMSKNDPEQILKAFDEIKTFQSSTYSRSDGSEGKVSELVDREVIDRVEARLRRAQSSIVGATDKRSNQMFDAVKNGYKRGFTGSELDEKANALQAKFLSEGDTQRYEELQIYKGLGQFKESLWGKTKAQKDAIIDTYLNTQSVEVDGTKYDLSLNAFNVVQDLKGTLEGMARQDEQLKQNNPYSWVSQQFPNYSPEENMQIQKLHGVDYPIPFPEETYQNIVQLARGQGVGTASAVIRKDFPNYIGHISAKLSADKSNNDLGELSLALIAPPQFADQVTAMTSPKRIETITTGFKNSPYKNSDLKELLNENEDYTSLQSQLNTSGQGGLTNAMAKVIKLDAMERMNRNVDPKVAFTQAVANWKDNTFHSPQSDFDLQSNIHIPLSIIQNADHQQDINHAIDSVDRFTLVKFGYSREVADSMMQNTMPVVQGSKIRFLNVSDGAEYKTADGKIFSFDINELNDPDSNPMYQDYVEFKNGTAKPRWTRNSDATFYEGSVKAKAQSKARQESQGVK